MKLFFIPRLTFSPAFSTLPTMQWVNLTSSALRGAMRDGLPVVLPLGSIEAHSDHLPLGNDTFKIEQTCIQAAEREPAVVLPPIYYTDVKSVQMRCGAVDMDGAIMIRNIAQRLA